MTSATETANVPTTYPGLFSSPSLSSFLFLVYSPVNTLIIHASIRFISSSSFLFLPPLLIYLFFVSCCLPSILFVAQAPSTLA